MLYFSERVAQRKREREIILQEVTNTTSYGSLEERPRPRPQQQAERMRVRLIPSNTGAAPPNKGHKWDIEPSLCNIFFDEHWETTVRKAFAHRKVLIIL